jgi:oxygen-independent coproporphyrinogen-3 oxidase
MAGIYIHIPFCKKACHYCDFHFSTHTSDRIDLLRGIITELHLQKDYLDAESIQTIYFGGGTPSLLNETELNSILDAIKNNFSLSPDAEITLEANPDDLSPTKVVALRNSGINRLSIGIQSFDDTVLNFLNRSHDAKSAHESVMLAREAGFNNISIDLIYAIPGQDNALWKKNILQAVKLNPEHISSYSLTVEPKTVFGNWLSKGKLNSVDDETAATQLEILVDELTRSGYEHYEVSNFSKPGFHSKHNSSYWRQEKYLGIGPSAHSYNGRTRHHTINNNALYTKSLLQGKIPFELEVLTAEDHINEYLLTTLRTSWGCDLKKLEQAYHYNLPKTQEQYLRTLLENGLAIVENDHLKLTKTGKLLADKISSDLFLTS